jgi:hypothetical protein
MQMKVMNISCTDLDLKARDTPKLRGAVASRFPGYSLLHHHIEENRLLYQYPRIQYKIINGCAMIIGIEEGIDVLKSIYGKLGEVRLDFSEAGFNTEVRIEIMDRLFGDCDDLVEYRFITPWMALNQKNYERFVKGSKESNDKLLKSILIGNILSLAKSFGYKIEARIYVRPKLSLSKATFKNKSMITFLGSFVVNFHIPDYLGIGKSVSRGFGTVKRV